MRVRVRVHVHVRVRVRVRVCVWVCVCVCVCVCVWPLVLCSIVARLHLSAVPDIFQLLTQSGTAAPA